jgi:hypothetical protein
LSVSATFDSFPADGSRAPEHCLARLQASVFQRFPQFLIPMDHTFSTARLLRVVTGLLFFAIVTGPGTAFAQQPLERITNLREVPDRLLPDLEKTCGLTAAAHQEMPPAPDRPKVQGKASADIRVQYGPGFDQNPAARDAFQRAVDTWSMHIESEEEIVIDATFQDFDDARILGGARPAYVFGDIDGETIVVAVNLLEAVRGDRVENFDPSAGHSASDPEIFASFNRTRTDWHFGEGPPPSGSIDFESVVLHEIGHGLQYASTFSYNTGSGNYACSGATDAACWGFGSGRPSTYDQQVIQYNAQDDTFVDMLSFPNDTQQLGDALTVESSEATTEQVRFNGSLASSNAGLTSGPQPPILYAPAPWQSGSSLSHLDEFTYPFGTENALMTPQLGNGESARLPGPIVCGSLGDMGWPLGPECLGYVQAPLNLQVVSRDIENGTVNLTWFASSNLDVSSYTVERRAFDGPFQEVATLPGDTDPAYTDENVGLGMYTYRLQFERGDGSTGTVEETPTVEIGFTGIERTVTEGDPTSSVQVDWSVPAPTSGYEYVVERSDGSGTTAGEFQRIASVGTSTSYEDTGLFPGSYTYRVRAVDANNNSLTSEETDARLSFEGSAFITGPNPNPIQSGMTQAELVISAQLPQDATIGVYNTLGQKVYEEQISLRQSAAQRVQIPTGRLSSGVYFVRIEAEEFSVTRRMAVTR